MGHSIFKADYPLMINWFKQKGYSGSLNEMIISYFRGQLGSTASGMPNDLIRSQLLATGLSGSTGDMLNKFFCQKTGINNPADASRKFFSDSTLDFVLINGIDSYTKLMLHLDNNVTDSELTPKTITNTNVTFDNTIYKFGGYSGSFNGSNAFLSAADSSDWNFGSGDFTIDFWIYDIGGGYIYSNGTGSTLINLISCSAGIIGFRGYNSGYEVDTYIHTAISANTWHHIALVRNGNTWYIFVDGVSQTLDLLNGSYSATLANKGNGINIGRRIGNADQYYSGKIDEFRISTGIARWTSNFTPPTSAYS